LRIGKPETLGESDRGGYDEKAQEEPHIPLVVAGRRPRKVRVRSSGLVLFTSPTENPIVTDGNG
jgi:hypothetical protein